MSLVSVHAENSWSSLTAYHSLPQTTTKQGREEGSEEKTKERRRHKNDGLRERKERGMECMATKKWTFQGYSDKQSLVEWTDDCYSPVPPSGPI